MMSSSYTDRCNINIILTKRTLPFLLAAHSFSRHLCYITIGTFPIRVSGYEQDRYTGNYKYPKSTLGSKTFHLRLFDSKVVSCWKSIFRRWNLIWQSIFWNRESYVILSYFIWPLYSYTTSFPTASIHIQIICVLKTSSNACMQTRYIFIKSPRHV